MNSQLYNKQFLKSYTLAILKVIEQKKYNYATPKQIVDADLIPKLSEELMRRYALGEALRRKLHEQEQVPQKDHHPLPPPQRTLPQPKQHQKEIPSTLVDPLDTRTGYQKIKPFLDDFSVSRIQCIAPQKPLIIIRAGQKITTKIALTKEDIHDVFLTITEMAHIPLIEGPVKVALQPFNIEGINSNIMDSKFIIQKNTAYAMLEKR